MSASVSFFYFLYFAFFGFGFDFFFFLVFFSSTIFFTSYLTIPSIIKAKANLASFNFSFLFFSFSTNILGLTIEFYIRSSWSVIFTKVRTFNV